MPCKPICTTCHTRIEGGYGTARKPFAIAMQNAGLMAKSPNLIAPALQKLEQTGSDVDKDGVPDVEELRNMEDPNAANTPLQCLDESPPPASGGCAVRTRRLGGDDDSRSILGAAVVATALVRARRRRVRTRR